MLTPKKHKESKEKAMLIAWLWDKHRTDRQWRRVRLGVLPTKELNRFYLSMLRWIDAIVISNGIVYLVEAKVRPMPGVISQLELYKELFYNTPDFSYYRGFPVRMMLLTSIVDVNMVELCSKKDIIYEVFSIDDVNRVRRETMQPVI